MGIFRNNLSALSAIPIVFVLIVGADYMLINGVSLWRLVLSNIVSTILAFSLLIYILYMDYLNNEIRKRKVK